jgi:uncharacterized membrane protein
MARLFSIKPGITLRGRTNKGLRGLSGKPLHPPLTDIPVAAYLFALTFDLISFFSTGELAENMYNAATYVLIGGFIASILTSLTGFWDWWKSTQAHTQAWRTANWHMAVMLTVTTLVIINLLVRDLEDGSVNTLGMVLSVLAGGIVSFGATYGGSLVFDYGFNVETSGDHPVWHESEEDVFPGQDK